MKSTRLFILTSLAMIAFASNSLLCRLALKHTAIDAATFTFIRIVSGAVALWLILEVRTQLRPERTASLLVGASSGSPRVSRHSSLQTGNWPSALALFVYAAAFSFAYIDLPVGTGALLLFGAVQASMILWGFREGERLDAIQVVGFVAAVIGLVVLVFPGLSAPPLGGSTLMLGAGVAWGVYSLRGKGVQNPASVTAGNFVRAIPFSAVVWLISLRWTQVDSAGITFAVISGAIASGLGYVIWYSALPGLKATSAATIQLSVPVLAAAGGILLLGEPITLRYLFASVAVLGGIALVIWERTHAKLT
jgi:drug/metabolite transporter (DMT)-like permease